MADNGKAAGNHQYAILVYGIEMVIQERINLIPRRAAAGNGQVIIGTFEIIFQRERGKFTLYGSNHFSLFVGETGEFLVSLGACEKLN